MTGHSFQVESDTFSLKNILEAPLLQCKEDLEVFSQNAFLLYRTLKNSPSSIETMLILITLYVMYIYFFN